jgi:TPR repeat protein
MRFDHLSDAVKTNNEPLPTAEAIRDLIRKGQQAEALRHARSLAESGAADGNLLLGWMYQAGSGGPQNLKAAEACYLRAATSGSVKSMYYLGSLYVMTGDFARAIEWFTRSSNGGFAAATYHLGRMFLFGQGVEQDRDVAMRYFEKAAKQGHLLAQRNIIHAMIKGQRGIMNIPVGLAKLLHLTYVLFKTGLRDPQSDRVLHL